MEASEPMWVNPILNIIGVNSFRFGGLHMVLIKDYRHANLDIAFKTYFKFV